MISYWLLKRQIRRDGKVACPVLVDRDWNVIDGNHRVVIARELGLSLPVIQIDFPVQNVDPALVKTAYSVKG
jgi:ParB-like chromosome segregation protein Spo0J